MFCLVGGGQSRLNEKHVFKSGFAPLVLIGFLTCFRPETGLTALRSDEVIDLMIKEYPAKHAEYSVILQEKERQRITDHYKEYSVSVGRPASFPRPGESDKSGHVTCDAQLPCVHFSKCSSRTRRRWRPAKCPSTSRKPPRKPRSSIAT